MQVVCKSEIHVSYYLNSIFQFKLKLQYKYRKVHIFVITSLYYFAGLPKAARNCICIKRLRKLLLRLIIFVHGYRGVHAHLRENMDTILKGSLICFYINKYGVFGRPY